MRVLAAALATSALAVAGLSACGDTFTEGADFVRTSTIPLGRQTALVVDAPVRLLVIGAARSTDLVYELRGTATASTTTIAATLADAVKVETEDVDGNGIALVFEGLEPTNGNVAALLRVWLPDDMDVSLIGRAGPVDVVDVGGTIDVVGVTHSRVTGATGSVRVRVDKGNAIADVSALPGTSIELGTNSGEVQVILPARPSVALQARADAGAILVRHPGLPAYPGGDLPYGAIVNGGLAQVVLTSIVGNVTIDVAP